MKEGLNFTLYEVFGYLMPGLIAAAGLSVGFWAVFHDQSVLPLSLWRLSPDGLLAALFVAYLLGHMVQSIGNMRLEGADKKVMAQPFAAFAKERLVPMLHGCGTQIADEWIQRIMDESCIKVGFLGDRDIFTYREGFYRGSTVAMALFCVGLVPCLVTGNLRLLVGDTVLIPSRGELSVVLLISILGVWLLYKRFQRFSRYRVSRVLAAFVALSIPQLSAGAGATRSHEHHE